MAFYLPKEESQFVHHVMEELETYQQKGDRKSVLLFPPLPSRLRYLIHKSTEELPELSTFSVGESWHRRLVVCHSELRGETEEDRDLGSNNSVCEKTLRHKEDRENLAKPKLSIPSRSRAPKRPDKPLYMPRAARERLSLQNPQGTTSYAESPASTSCISTSPDNCSCHEATESTNVSSASRQESHLSGTHSSSQEENEKLVLRLHEAEPFVWGETVSCFSDLTLEDYEKDKEYFATAPCSTQTEDLDTDVADVSEEIKAHLKEAVSFSVEHVHNDYSVYENVCINPDDFRHVIEIYNFPCLFKTEDLLDAFTDYSGDGMKIKWVDNTHALGVFSSESAALHALSICHPILKTRALAEASKKAKSKAISRAEFIQPVKERPKTDSAVARRMVARALGLRGRGPLQRY